ncbi:MAG: helix-turn-helix transcriptional regulator [Lentimicrobiaceae bacterium]|nr:helix-turn-helix transcriptional regulator [Lentimicrobiaceae bacterium]
MNDRIELLIKVKNLTPARFADELNLQRANVSHILNGRNKPSLDFVQRVIKRYPDVNIPWLLFGEGEILSVSSGDEENEAGVQVPETTDSKVKAQPRTMELFPREDPVEPAKPAHKELAMDVNDKKNLDYQQDEHSNTPVEVDEKLSSEKTSEMEDKSEAIKEDENKIKLTAKESHSAVKSKELRKIIFFYDDRTFETFTPE